MDLKTLFVEQPPSASDDLILSTDDLVKFLTVQEAGNQPPAIIIQNWFGEFFSRPGTVQTYHLFPTFHHQLHTFWHSWGDPYITHLLLACDCLYHLHENHPDEPDLIRSLMEQFSQVLKDSIKGQQASAIDALIETLCGSGRVMPEQPAPLFRERPKAARVAPPVRFYTLTHQDLFGCLCDGLLPEDCDKLELEKRQQIIEALKQAIGVRKSYSVEMMGCLNRFSADMGVKVADSGDNPETTTKNSGKPNLLRRIYGNL